MAKKEPGSRRDCLIHSPPLNSFLKPAKSFISTAQQSQNKLSFDFGWAEGEEIPEGQEATATERKD